MSVKEASKSSRGNAYLSISSWGGDAGEGCLPLDLISKKVNLGYFHSPGCKCPFSTKLQRELGLVEKGCHILSKVSFVETDEL